jgi:hypothetical protein
VLRGDLDARGASIWMRKCRRTVYYGTSSIWRFWRKIEWHGTCQVDWVHDAGAAEYVTKQLVRPGYLEQIILANDFHPDRDRSSDEERGDQEGFSEPIIDLS